MIGVEPLQATDETTASAAETISVTDTFKTVKKLKSIIINWTAGSAPTTSENVVVLLDSGKGTPYDVTLKSFDPSTYEGGVHEWSWSPDPTVDGWDGYCGMDDHVKVTYANTDDLGIGLVMTFESL